MYSIKGKINFEYCIEGDWIVNKSYIKLFGFISLHLIVYNSMWKKTRNHSGNYNHN